MEANRRQRQTSHRLTNEFALVDIFRERNQHKTSYTYESKALKLSSRIDFFLIAQHLTKWVERVETKVSNYAPDHRAVKFTISIAQVPRGPGLWKFNKPLLEDVCRSHTKKLYCHQRKVCRSQGQKTEMGIN